MASQRFGRSMNGGGGGSGSARGSPAKKEQKQVVFQLVDPGDPTLQARLPMRVMLSPKDTTDSIITTVKNFWGLYEMGVSFENKEGISIIATFDNFENDMTVYVRTVPLPSSVLLGEHARDSASPHKPSLGAPFEMRPTLHSGALSPSHAARSAGARSMSPQSDLGRRSTSAAPGGKARLQRKHSRDGGLLGDAEGYSSGMDDQGSVASSRRSKAEEIKAEITVDNIVEGGRRKRMFESSELPLFVPPQIPISTSISSTSPQRRTGPPNGASPYAFSNQHTFSYQQPLPSPQSYGVANHFGQNGFPTNPYQNGLPRPLRGARSSGASYSSNRHSNGHILPTPDPTVGSVISDEDVALQLMRLGDPTAFSHGRTSTSTYDDALSGKADAASSDEGESEEDDEDDDDDQEEDGDTSLPAAMQYSREDAGPARKKQRMMNEMPSDATSGEEYEDRRDGTFHGAHDRMHGDMDDKAHKLKHKSHKHSGANGASIKSGKPRSLSVSKSKKGSLSHAKVPMSPASLTSQSRKASISSINFQNQLGPNEEDLSSKPRCQRCRKSKKGCDRQRPCGRCKDAGIGIEGCISEDEGNGRKGRYGRHMNIPIKKGDEMIAATTESPIIHQQASMPANGYFLAPALPDKSKKRKK